MFYNCNEENELHSEHLEKKVPISCFLTAFNLYTHNKLWQAEDGKISRRYKTQNIQKEDIFDLSNI